MQIKEILAVGMYKHAVTLYLQLLQSMVNHFVDDEHFCYFDDMYSPEYTMQWIYEAIQKHDVDAESYYLLNGDIRKSCGANATRTMAFPSYIDK